MGEQAGDRGVNAPAREQLAISRMKQADLEQVMAIEKVSFLTPWSRAAYQRELRENSYAHYLVGRTGDRIVAYGGMWQVLDEAHVTTFAVAPAERGRGLGGYLLTAMLGLAADLGATRMTLEVRRSNVAAQRLYTRHRFTVCGVRRQYYTDTREDALIMAREGIDSAT